MAVVKVKPTSPGRRAVVKVVHAHLYKGRPEASLLEPQMQNAGRNNNGHITIRHKGGGHKHHYRVVDFVRNKDGIPAKVERIEYDPNRTAHIGERMSLHGVAGVAVGGSVELNNSYAGVIAGREVSGEKIESVILFSRKINGNVTTVMDTRSALIAGLVGGLFAGIMLLLGRSLFGRK